MQIINCEQNTDEWIQARLGKPTASAFNKIINADGTRSKQRQDYMYILAGERISQRQHYGYKNAFMDKGHEVEEISRYYYEFQNGVDVEKVGFCLNDCGRYGCSPDGLVSFYGGFETKSAEPHIQAKRLHKGWKGTEYHRQIMGSLLITGRAWWDLVSYCEGMKPVVVRFERDEDFINTLYDELNIFCDELDGLVNRIK